MLFQKLGNIGRTIQHLNRFREIVGVFLKYGYEDLAHRLHLPQALNLRSQRGRDEQVAIHGLSQPQKVRRACEELGPTFVKIGQILSTRPQLLPDGFAEELAKLQDSVAPIAFAEVRQVVESGLKRPLAEVYSEFEETPIGSASMAQVHRARLLIGQRVVVKVQRPGIEEKVRIDLEILHQVAALAENHLQESRVHRPTAVVEEIRRTLQQELDFTTEAAHLERFARQFAGEPTIYIPAVYHEASTRQLITMEYIEGIKASKLQELAGAQLDPPEIARRIADLMMKQFFVHGFFHADPHPGNIHILPGNVICFLDFGMMGFLGRRGRENFSALVTGIARRNEVAVADALIRLSSPETEPSRPALETETAEFMHQHFYRPLAELEFGKLTTELVQLTTRHGLRIPPDFFLMLKSLSAMETLVRQLHPGHNLIEQVTPFLKRVRLQRFGPRKLAENFFEVGLDFAELASAVPGELRRIMAHLKSGETRVIFKHEGLEPAMNSWDRGTNRLAYAIMLAAMVIGSAVVVHAKIPPVWREIPVIGLAGFIISALMAVGLILAILKHGKM